MHPHRGFDILTYVLDGSDGFRHRDSLGGSKTYRGASAQWMRTGAGAMHEEFWETSDDRRTSIELFQIWINLPASRKMDPPTVRYLGAAHGAPWREEVVDGGTRVRTVLNDAILDVAEDGEGATPKPRPRAEVYHAHIPKGGTWSPKVGGGSCSLYCREGKVTVPGPAGELTVKAGESVGFASGADAIACANAARGESDVLLLVGDQLREPVAMGGPIVMNYQSEVDEAYRELQAGTFLSKRTDEVADAIARKQRLLARADATDAARLAEEIRRLEAERSA